MKMSTTAVQNMPVAAMKNVTDGNNLKSRNVIGWCQVWSPIADSDCLLICRVICGRFYELPKKIPISLKIEIQLYMIY